MARSLASRRRFLRQLGALGFVVPLASLAACGGATSTTPPAANSSATTRSAASATSAARSGATSQRSTGSAVAAAASAAPGALRLQFWCDIGTPYPKVAQHWADTFPATHPGASVQFAAVVDNYNDKITAAYASGSPPDIFRYLQEHTPIDAAVKDNLLLNLSGYAERDKYDFSDFLPQAVNLYRWQGKLYALPRDYGAQFIFYNVDMFQKMGVPLPPTKWDDRTWTYSKFIETAKRLTVSQGGTVTQWGCAVNTGWRPWASFVYSNGATVVQNNSAGESTATTLTDEKAAAGVQFLQDLMYKYHVAPQAKEKSPAFSTGSVAMIVNNPGAVKVNRQIKSFTWDVAALPIGDQSNRRGTGGGGTGWGAAALTKHPDQAWQFVAFIASRQAELDEVAIGGTTPSRKSVIQSPEFLDPGQPPKNGATFPDGQQYVVADPVNLNWPNIQSQIVNPQMGHVWDGSQPAGQVAATIKQLADPQLKAGLTT